MVHGLWPQYEQGFPAFCQVPAPRLDRAIVGSMLDLMPSPRLIFHEWDRHGTCSGLSPHAYFETVRKARAVVKIPPDYLELDKPIMVTPDEVAEAFVKANPGLSRAALAVACDSKRLERSARVSEQGFFLPRLRRGDAPRLQTRQPSRCRRCAADESRPNFGQKFVTLSLRSR